MTIHRGQMKTEVKEKLRGGAGSTGIAHCLDCEKVKHVTLFAEMTLQPGCSIGDHRHDNETEYYIIISGSGKVNDNGAEVTVNPGDVVVTVSGEHHGIENTGSVSLLFYAIIVKD